MTIYEITITAFRWHKININQLILFNTTLLNMRWPKDKLKQYQFHSLASCMIYTTITNTKFADLIMIKEPHTTKKVRSTTSIELQNLVITIFKTITNSNLINI